MSAINGSGMWRIILPPILCRDVSDCPDPVVQICWNYNGSVHRYCHYHE